MLDLQQKILRDVSALDNLRQSLIGEIDPGQLIISICCGTACLASGAEEVSQAFVNEVEKRELQIQVKLTNTGCHGFCEKGPLVVINPQGILYQHVTPDDIEEIVTSLLAGTVVERLLYIDPQSGEKIEQESKVPFYSHQQRLVFKTNGEIDPTNIEDYIRVGGYAALSKVLFRISQEVVIEEIKKSGLRGRGGGGFPTGRKWESCRIAKGDTKYVICNADEGDPGAYMDRSLLEGNPHSILEGMVIGAYAIGSNEGYIYVRNEYPLAVTNAGLAIEQAMRYGLLGDDILGSGFNFTVKIVRGGGAFVCGESSALMASLEGKVGEPRAKYIHTVEEGLWGNPSNLNNVETWANVPLIVNKGAEWYSNIGTEGSKGTKVFSLVGNINNTGLVEVPMGITLREIIYDIGGGIPGGKEFKAVQTGGPSGGCIPAQFLDTPVDFDELTKLGSMMGSGGMIVMDEDTCMVDVAKYFIDFLKEESCGKCVCCREGLTRMSEILNRITEGEGTMADLDTLQDLGEVLADGALCALGSTAANPVITTIRYFKDEYIAHVKDQRCPAGVCSDLIKFSIDADECNGCHRCFRVCPTGSITGEKKKPHDINQGMCIQCGACYDVCKFDAVIKQ
ncbi:NADH-ubiquinone oxidoreductase-F iron-sulfur binding region domain-containing protein [Chloroflexota bacterium]